MKKIIAILVGVLAFAAVASAQPRALGIRVGGNGAELSYQQSLGNNFAEFDLGAAWGHGFGLSLTGTYDFIFASAGIVNFYVGPGASLAFYNYNDGNTSSLQFFPGIVAQLGFEFEIPSIPMNISIDWMPGYYFNSLGTVWGNAALGLRYRF